MCRNHRGFMDATVACSRLGAHALYLNTMFAGPQLADVVAREGARAIVYDEEFAALLGGVRGIDKRFVAWHDGESAAGDPLLEDLIAAGDPAGVPPAEEPGRVVILTSGTTGTPKGARRSHAGLSSAAALLSKIPYRARETTMIAAPLFHSWGLANYTLGVPLASTLRAAPALRPGGHAARHRPPPHDRARRRAGDAAADPRAAAGDARPLRHLVAAHHRGQRLGAAGPARDARDGPVRRRALQPLRLDRGRVGDDRHARRTCAPRPAARADRRSARS